MSLHDLNSKYLGFSLVGIVGLALAAWSIHLSYFPVTPSTGPSGGTNNQQLASKRGSVPVSDPNRNLPVDRQNSSENVPEPKGRIDNTASPTWGYAFPNASGIYSIRFVGFPNDLDDASMASLIKYNLEASQQGGRPTAVIMFRAEVDSNRQSEQCTSMNGVSAVVDFLPERKLEGGPSLLNQGSGFACLGNDRRIAELEALGQAFTNMRISQGDRQ